MEPLEQLGELLAEYRRATAQPFEQFCPHTPTPKQAEFLALDCLEAMYGGAVGGGKSDALLMGAMQYVNEPIYSALILRKTYADLSLPGAIMDRAKTWLRPGVPWADKEKRFTFPSGATLTFGYLQHADDVFRYQSAEFQYIAFDELTQFPEKSYRYMLSRLRRPEGSKIPLRARSASNPGGIGHAWVKRRFVDGVTKARFVPAKLAENPHVDQEAYLEALNELDAVTRRQLLEGIWVQDAAGLVYSGFDERRNVAPQIPQCEFYLLGIDYGFTDETAFCVLGWRDNDPRIYVVSSEKLAKMTPSRAAERVHELEQRYKFVRIVADIGGLGKGYAEEARARFGTPIEPADKNNKRGYISLFNGDLERARIIAHPSCTGLVKEWCELPWDEEHIKELDGFDNHEADACLYAWRACTAYHNVAKEEKPKPGTNEAYAAEQARIEEHMSEKAQRPQEWWME